MNSRKLSFLLLAVLVLSFCFPYTHAEGDKKESKTLNKPQGSPIRTLLNVNNISTVFKNTGISDIDRDEQNSGLVYPKGSGKAAVFTSGLLWGCKIAGDPQARVGGAAYSEGLQGGRITNSGVPYTQLTFEDPNAPNVRIFRVRPDVYPGGPSANLSSELNDNEGSEAEIRAQYELDWNEWPAAIGAPFDDKNGNGTYEPATDVPGVPGADQTVWYVANDLNVGNVADLYGALPLGVEQQATYWAYNRTGALGSMYFRKYKIINKSNTVFDSMYVSMWSDVDLGNSVDDFAGCDTVLSLGYCYNANAVDATYTPLPPPAVGFDFFQGPLINGVAGEDKNKNGIDDADDFGIFGGKVVGPGKINLPMTSFYYFARGDANLADPTRKASEGSTQFYNFFQGRIGKTGAFFVDPSTNQPTTFALPGDPITRTGWIDGQVLSADDRRIGQGSGPFFMSPGDTQEVVVAEIVAGAIPGVDRLSAIGLLKFYDRTAQDAFNNFFDLPNAAPAPEVSVPGTYDANLNVYYALDRKIVLDWGENPSKVSATESFNDKGYQFEGYNVYQLPNAAASVEEGRKIATFDLSNGILKIEGDYFDLSTGTVARKVQQTGSDGGIRRYFEITRDELKGGTPLINGTRYYYAVTSYTYNPAATISNLENPISILTIIPTSKAPGVTYGGAFGDTLSTIVHSKGSSDGNVFPMIVDPSKLTGLTYKVSFSDLNGSPVWNLDRSDGVRVLSDQSNQNADDVSPIVDGVQWKVIGAPNDFKLFSVVANAAGPLATPEPGAFGFGGFPTPTDGPGEGNPEAGVQQSTNNSRWGIHTADNGTRGDYASFLTRTADGGSKWPVIIPYDFEIRFTAAGGWGFDYYNSGTLSFQVPFELWNIGSNTQDDPSDDYRMIPILLDDDLSGTFNMGAPGTKQVGTYDHSVSSADNDPYTDWIYWAAPVNRTPGQAGYLEAEAQMMTQAYTSAVYESSGAVEILRRIVLVEWNGGSAPPFIADLPETGTIFRIQSTKPNVVNGDEFTITVPTSSYNLAEAKTDIKKVNVFPNPYYGVNSEELNKYNRFVTLTHLPTKATIRIFNLAGVMVRTLEKDNNSTYQRWDLANESGLPVASGLYIAYIEFPDLGETKVLKIAIIQEQQILDRF